MPIYEYSCDACQAKFEALVRSMASQTTTRCPSCGSSRVRKVLSLFGLSRASGDSGAATPRGNACLPSGT